LVLLDKGWALVIISNKDSCVGSLALLFLKKLINQLDETMLGLAALVEVFIIEIGVILIAIVISVDSISRLIEIKEY
jgi:hypothetical protein